MGETDAERVQLAQDLLEKRVRRETIVDTRLDGHDRRLAAINGQIERGARATELVAERLTQLSDNVDDLSNEIKTKGAVDTALQRRAEDALKSQITRREFWMGVCVIVVAVMSVAMNAGLL